MQITRDTPNQLILAYTPWLIGLFLVVFILIFVGAGLAMFMGGETTGLFIALAGGGMGVIALFAFVRRIQVIFDRPSDSITLRRRSLLGYSETRHTLSNLSGAILETTSGDKGRTLYRPALILDKGMSAGTHPIVKAYTNSSGPKRAVTAINTWLDVGPVTYPA